MGESWFLAAYDGFAPHLSSVLASGPEVLSLERQTLFAATMAAAAPIFIAAMFIWRNLLLWLLGS